MPALEKCTVLAVKLVQADPQIALRPIPLHAAISTVGALPAGAAARFAPLSPPSAVIRLPRAGCIVHPSAVWLHRGLGAQKRMEGCMNWPDKITHAIHCGLLLAVFVVLSSLLYWLLRS